jgi:RimJ/RimL family protein N-acetyltransferase
VPAAPEAHAGVMTTSAATPQDLDVDGVCLRIASITCADAPALERFHEALSAATTHRRFFNVHPHLSPRELARFTDVDHLDREALVAFEGPEIVAVARLDRSSTRSGTAEVAFVAADRWQHRGLMTALFHCLVVRARALGIDVFVADTLASNAPMLALFRHAGLPCSSVFADGVVRVTLDLSTAS